MGYQNCADGNDLSERALTTITSFGSGGRCELLRAGRWSRRRSPRGAPAIPHAFKQKVVDS